MKRLSLALSALLTACSPSATTALKPGDRAPDFTAPAALGGKVYTYSLADALKHGPVVLYFYPAAFTTGCTLEAHDFAAAIDRYKALGASVIGVSHDDIGTLQRFSVSECRSRFPVAADADGRIMKAYGAVMPIIGKVANRVSYVIAPNGTIIYRYVSLLPGKHVSNTLNALQQWKAQQAAHRGGD